MAQSAPAASGQTSYSGATADFAGAGQAGEWTSQARDYANTRYSPLDQINAGNVGKLKLAAYVLLASEGASFITNPARDRRRSHAVTAAGFALPLSTEPMEARSAATLPTGSGWQYEPKWDGFRCLAFKADGEVDLRAKSGKPLGRYFPEVVGMLHHLSAARFIIDGELVVEQGGALAFDALQQPLHPAQSRIRKLAAATPARIVLFDMLEAPDGTLLRPCRSDANAWKNSSLPTRGRPWPFSSHP